MTAEENIIALEKKFLDHRTGPIACEETCFCWEVDYWFARIEAEREEEDEYQDLP